MTSNLLHALFLATLSAAAVPSQEDLRARVAAVVDAWSAARPQRPEAELTDELVALGRSTSPYLCDLVESRSAGLPVAPIARAIGKMQRHEAAPVLGGLLTAKKVQHRLAAVEALRSLRQREALEFLAVAVDDAEAAVQVEAEAALLSRDFGAQWVVPALAARLPEARSKGRLAQILGKLGSPEAHDVLVALLQEWGDDSKLAALQGLAVFGRSEDGPLVMDVLSDAVTVAVEKQAALFLGRVKCLAAVPDLIGLLTSDDPGLVANAHWALKRISGLRLNPDPALWNAWWERSGKKQLDD